MKKKAGLLLISAFTVVVLVLWVRPDADATIMPGASLPTARLAGDAAPVAAPATFTTGLEALPRSLRDTEVDGELEVDERGHLRITRGVRHVFDYFLSATGEESQDLLLQRLRAYFRHKLPAGAAAEAGRLLDGYIAYKKGRAGLQGVTPSGSGQVDIAAVREQMQQVQALRLQFLAPEVIAAFFGEEDVFERYSLARLEILQNSQLTPQARAQQLATAEEQLPAALRESIKVITRVQDLQALTQDWQKRGGSPAELHQIREQLVGAEATGRLEVLDQQRAAWDSRMRGWYSERAALLGNRSLGEQDRQAQLEALRAQRFSADERQRVEALEQMHDQG